MTTAVDGGGWGAEDAEGGGGGGGAGGGGDMRSWDRCCWRFAHRPRDRAAAWGAEGARGHDSNTVVHVFCNSAPRNTGFTNHRREATDRHHGASLGFDPVLQAAERWVRCTLCQLRARGGFVVELAAMRGDFPLLVQELALRHGARRYQTVYLAGEWRRVRGLPASSSSSSCWDEAQPAALWYFYTLLYIDWIKSFLFSCRLQGNHSNPNGTQPIRNTSLIIKYIPISLYFIFILFEFQKKTNLFKLHLL